MNNARLGWIGADAAAVLLAAAAAPALAQEAGERALALEEVVVTARRKEENLQAVPVAISVVSGDMLREQSVVKFEDLQRAVPSLAISQSVRGGGSPGVAIRGQRGATTTTSLIDPAVSVYFAEFNLSRSTGTNQSLYDLQSIQVLKGPQGTLFGRNSTGGAMLITPNKPVDRFEGYVQAAGGDYTYRDVEGMVNVPLGDTLAMRAAAKHSRRDGYMENVLNGQEMNDLHADSYRLSLAWNPNDAVESLLIGTYYDNGGRGPTGKLDFIEPRGIGANTVAPAIVLAGLQAELAATQALDDYEFRDTYSYNSSGYTWSVQNNTTIDAGTWGVLGDVTLKNIAGYKKVYDRYANNFAGADISLIQYQNPTIDSESYSEEFQLQGKSGRVDYVTGVYYFHEASDDAFDSVQLTYLTTPEALALATPAQRTAILTNLPSITRNNASSENESYAVFAHANVELTQTLSLSLGARMTWDKREVTWRTIRQSGTSTVRNLCVPTNVSTVAPAAPPPCSVGRDLSSSEPTYDIGLNYQPNDDLLLYAVHRHGYRTGGFNIVPPAGLATDPSYEPEKVDDFEIGEKWDFNIGSMAARLNTALYYQNYEDIQRTTTVLVGPSLNTQLFNAAKAHIQGGEIELTLEPISAVRVMLAYALTDAEYDKWEDRYNTAIPVAAAPADCTVVTVGAAQRVSCPVDISDSAFASVPKHQYTATASYELPLPDSFGKLTWFGSYAWQSSMYAVENTTRNCGRDGTYINCVNVESNVDGYGTVNTRLDWRDVARKGFDLSFFVNNLTDEHYETFQFNTLSSLGFTASVLGAPRMWGAEVRYRFGDQD